MSSRRQIRCECRLTVLGTKRDVRRFQASAWEKSLRARYYDPLQLSPCRFVGQFETDGHDLKRLQRLSRSHPGLVHPSEFVMPEIRVFSCECCSMPTRILTAPSAIGIWRWRKSRRLAA